MYNLSDWQQCLKSIQINIDLNLKSKYIRLLEVYDQADSYWGGWGSASVYNKFAFDIDFKKEINVFYLKLGWQYLW